MTIYSKAFCTGLVLLAAFLAGMASCAGPKGGTKGKKVDKSVQTYLAGPGKMQYLVMPQDFTGPEGTIVVDITARDSAMAVQSAVLHFSMHLPAIDERIDSLWLVSDAGMSRAYPEPKAFLKEREDKGVHYRFESVLVPDDFKTFIRSSHRAIVLKRKGVKSTYTQTKRTKKRFDTASGQMMF